MNSGSKRSPSSLSGARLDFRSEWKWRSKRSFVSLRLHHVVVKSRAIHHQPLPATWLEHALRSGWDREHMRDCSPSAFLRRRMGSEYSILPRPRRHWPGCLAKVDLEWTVCVERGAMSDAVECRSLARHRQYAHEPCGLWPHGHIHGQHSRFPRSDWETEKYPCRCCRVFLSQGHCPFHVR